MGQKSITQFALRRLRKIHRLSQKYNKKVKFSHNKRLLGLIKDHADEIKELMGRKDPHAFIETGDLMILCFEVLIENHVDIDETLFKCYERYKNKLNSLLRGVKK